MSRVSYADLYGLFKEPAQPEEISPGDVVRTGENNHPKYQVLAVQAGKAWVRNLDNAVDAIVDAARCRKIRMVPAE